VNHGPSLHALFDRWLDPILAAIFFLAAVCTILIGSHGHRGGITLESARVAMMAVPLCWRRKASLPVSFVVLASTALPSLPDAGDTVALLLVVALLPYSVAAYTADRFAVAGMVGYVAALGAIDIAVESGSRSLLFGVACCLGSYAVGRGMRSHRMLAAELASEVAHTVVEGRSRELLVLAEERTRIARELNALVAGTVTSMVVESQMARRLLDRDPVGAQQSIASLTSTGRQAMGELRRMLGVLRREEDPLELGPLPGFGQIHALIERERQAPRRVDLRVEGDPVPVAPSTELCLYRALEEAFAASSGESAEPIEVVVRFATSSVELDMRVASADSPPWPTAAMRERVAACGGEIEVGRAGQGCTHLRIRAPAADEGALAWSFVS
jgi:signal transduction histidine kinase